MKIIILVFLLLIPSYSNAQFESVLKELKSTVKSLDKKEQQKAQKPESNNNQQELDCESSQEAYQACLSKSREATNKNGLPKEYHGKWASDKKYCSYSNKQLMQDFEGLIIINANSFGYYGFMCDMQSVSKATSVGHLDLSMKCKDNGVYERKVTLILIGDNKIEVSEDSFPELPLYGDYNRCPN